MASSYRYDSAHGQTTPRSIDERFEGFSKTITRWTGSTQAFGFALGVIVLWAVLGPVFHFSDTWQLVINTGDDRDFPDGVPDSTRAEQGLAVAALEGASNRLVDVEALSEKDLSQLHRYYAELAALTRKEQQLTESHSVEGARTKHAFKRGSSPKPRG